MKLLMLFFLFFLLVQFSYSGLLHESQIDSVQVDKEEAIRVYLDCDRCDFDYVRSEITYVNYVRDRHDAQVNVLITDQRTAGQGREYTLAFIGRKEFTGVHDTLIYTSKEADSEEIIRKGITRIMKLGLTRYVARTSFGRELNISYTKSEQPQKPRDIWNNWVFRLSLNSHLNGEKSTNSMSLYGNVSASRVTQEAKLRISGYGNYNENNFDIGGTTISSFSRSRGMEVSYVPSLTDHWSAMGQAGISASTFNNTRLAYYVGPGIEYNIFPYTESTHRELRCAYKLSFRHFDYKEETIYNSSADNLVRSQLSVTAEVREVWGKIEASLSGHHYLHDFKRNSVELYVELDLRIVEGLSFTLYGNWAMVNDQLGLPKRGASSEEVLLQRRQLETQFRYFASIGLSYTFGSIYNNIVNPRFGN